MRLVDILEDYDLKVECYSVLMEKAINERVKDMIPGLTFKYDRSDHPVVGLLGNRFTTESRKNAELIMNAMRGNE